MDVAVKCVSKSKVQIKELKQELLVFSQDLNHKNIVKVIDVLYTKHKLYQVLEFCDGDNLRTILSKNIYFDERLA